MVDLMSLVAPGCATTQLPQVRQALATASVHKQSAVPQEEFCRFHVSVEYREAKMSHVLERDERCAVGLALQRRSSENRMEGTRWGCTTHLRRNVAGGNGGRGSTAGQGRIAWWCECKSCNRASNSVKRWVGQVGGSLTLRHE